MPVAAAASGGEDTLMERFNILRNIARFAEILGKTEDPTERARLEALLRLEEVKLANLNGR